MYSWGLYRNDVGTGENIYGLNHKFKSTGSGDLTFVTTDINSNAVIYGNGTRGQTYITLTELPNVIETTKWT